MCALVFLTGTSVARSPPLKRDSSSPKKLVRVAGIEPATSSLSEMRSKPLNYTRIFVRAQSSVIYHAGYMTALNLTWFRAF